MADEDKQTQSITQATQIALLIQKVDTLTDSNRDDFNGIRAQISTLEANLRKPLDDHETRLRLVESQLGKLQERLTTWQIFQVVFTSAAAGVSAFFKRP